MQQKLTFGFSTDRADLKPDQRTPNKRIDLNGVRELFTHQTYCSDTYHLLPDLKRQWHEEGSTEEKFGNASAEAKYNRLKKDQAWVTMSGFCPIGHDNKSLQYNGCIQGDIDFKFSGGDKLALEALERIKVLQPDGVLLATISGGIYGVKLLVSTNNTKVENHKEAAKQVIKYLADLLQVDAKYFDSLAASQPCFTAPERTPGQLYWRPDVTQFDVCFLPAKVDDYVPQFRKFEITGGDELSEMAAHIITNIKWSARHRNDFISVMICCKSLFDESTALSILEKCPEWYGSVTQKDWASQWKSTPTKQSENGGILKTLANSDKQKPFVSSKLKAIREWKEKRRQQSVSIAGGDTIQPPPPPAAPDLNNLIAQRGEYLADVLQRYGLPLDHIIGKFNIAGTGTGKTTAFEQIVERDPKRKLILVLPQTSVINRVFERSKNAVKYIGGNRNVSPEDRFYVTTVQSFPALATRVDLREWDVVFDEAHAITCDTSKPYKLKDIRSFYNFAKGLAKSLSFITGTDLPNFHPDFKEIPRLVIKSDARIKKTVYLEDAKNVMASSVAKFKESADAGRFPVILLNDKNTKLEELRECFKDMTVAYMNADEKKTDFFEKITSKGIIPDGVQGIVTTTVFREGCDVFDDRHFDFIIIGEHHHATIEQLTSRVRNAKEVSIFIIKSKDRKTTTRGFDAKKMASELIKRTHLRVDEWNNIDPNDDEQVRYAETYLSDIVEKLPVFTNEKGKLELCHFALNNHVHKLESRHQYQNDQYLIDQLLEMPGFSVVNQSGTVIEHEHNKELQQEIKQAKTTFKEVKRLQHESDLDKLRAAINPMSTILAAERANEVPKCFKWAKRLIQKYKIETRQAIELLQEVDTGKKFSILEAKINVQIIRTHPRHEQRSTIWALITKKIDKDFIQGEQYTADELREKLVECLSLDKSKSLDDLRPRTIGATMSEAKKTEIKEEIQTANRRAFDILRGYFNIQEVGRGSVKKTGENCPRKREYILYIEHIFADKKRTQLPENQHKKQTSNSVSHGDQNTVVSFLNEPIEDALF